MLALSKPLSSPSRADKFPPPLLRFLRSNVGSTSRGRSRTSPIFYMRSRRNDAAGVETAQEPSSPKVTCIGQVRARRSVKSRAIKTGSGRRCWWVKKALFCGRFSWIFRSQKWSCRRVFRKWGLFFGSGYCKKVDHKEDSFRVYSKQKNEKHENSGNISGSEDCNTEKYELHLGAQLCSPPRNALLLTRCRSAPYRSSSLGGRFWNSPLSEKRGENETETEAKSEESQQPRIDNLEEKPRISEELENPVRIEPELKGIAGKSSHPLLLTRCKSEPARAGERLNPEANWWRQNS